MADAAVSQARPAPAGSPVLEIAGLNAWYGESHVLHGVALDVRPGEVVTLLGRNGAGKTTILRSIMGVLGRRTGSVRFGGRETIGMASRHIAKLGIGYVPEERGIFSSLTVRENLLLPPRIAPGGMDVDQLYAMFPNLRERSASMGGRLSGGEQQMLAIARILRTGARFLLLDEPTEGLAPVIVEAIGKTIRLLKDQGYTLILVEQSFHFAAQVSDRNFIIEEGRTVDMIPSADLHGSMAKLNAYLGV